MCEVGSENDEIGSPPGLLPVPSRIFNVDSSLFILPSLSRYRARVLSCVISPADHMRTRDRRTVPSRFLPIFCAQDTVGAANLLVRVVTSPEAHQARLRLRGLLEREQRRPGWTYPQLRVTSAR